MRVWIDATQPESRLRAFGMSLVERQLRAFGEVGSMLRSMESFQRKLGGRLEEAERQLSEMAVARIRATEIWIEVPADETDHSWMPDPIRDCPPIRWMTRPGTTLERLQRALEDADGERVLAFSGDSVVDPRLFEHLAWAPGKSVAFINEDNVDCGAAISLAGPLPAEVQDSDSVLSIAHSAVKSGFVEQIRGEDYNDYILKLRRRLPPYIFGIANAAARDRVERFLFASNYKGATDFMTKWVYPPLVWALVRPLAERRVAPNTVTAVAIVACFAAVPFFAAGSWVPGLILAYVMSVLDSVDGKLARLTFQSSPQGDVLDHGTDLIHPPFWYGAWAWGLSGGDPLSPLIQASGWMIVAYMFGRVLEALFKASTGGRSIHDYTPLDVKMRTVFARRNVNLALLTISLPLGLAVEAFYFMAFWQVACAAFHLTRVIKFWDPKKVIS